MGHLLAVICHIVSVGYVIMFSFTGQADKIKSVMSGFQLPTTNIPDWAKTLSDDQLKKLVTNKLVDSETSQVKVNKQVKSDTSLQEVNKQGTSGCDTKKT